MASHWNLAMEVQDEAGSFNISDSSDRDPLNISNTPSSSSTRPISSSGIFGFHKHSKLDNRLRATPPVDAIPIMVDNVPFFLSQAEDGSPIYIRQQAPTIEEMFLTSSSEGNPSFDGFSDASGSAFEGFSEKSRSGSSSVTFEGFIENQLNSERLKLLEAVKQEEEELSFGEFSSASSEERYQLMSTPGRPNTSTPSGRPNTSIPSGRPNTSIPSGRPNTDYMKKRRIKDKKLKKKKIGYKGKSRNAYLQEEIPQRITRQAVQRETQVAEKIVSIEIKSRSDVILSRGTKRSQRLPSEERKQTVVEVVLDAGEDYIGEYCNAIGCTISFLESLRIKYLSVNNGIVYELNEFAKKISWDRIYIAKWVQRLTGVRDKTVEPTADDMLKINSILKRRKALKVTLAGQKKTGDVKMKEFDQTEFILPSSIKQEIEEAELQHIKTGAEENRGKKSGIDEVHDIKEEYEDVEVKEEVPELYESKEELSVETVKEECTRECPKETSVTHTQVDGSPSLGGTFGVSKSGRLRKPSVKGKQSFEIKSLFMSPDESVPGVVDEENTGEEDAAQRSNSGRSVNRSDSTPSSSATDVNTGGQLKYLKHKKLMSLNNKVISFTFTDGHFVPKFKEIDYNLGEYCQAAGITVEDINAETAMDVQLTKGLVKELLDFYVSRGSPKTSLAIRLLKIKGFPFSDYNEVLGIVAKIGKISYVTKDPQKLEQPFILGPEKKAVPVEKVEDKRGKITSRPYPVKPVDSSYKRTLVRTPDKPTVTTRIIQVDDSPILIAETSALRHTRRMSGNVAFLSKGRKCGGNLDEATVETKKRRIIGGASSVQSTEINLDGDSDEPSSSKTLGKRLFRSEKEQTPRGITDVEKKRACPRKKSTPPQAGSQTEDEAVLDGEVMNTRGKEGSITRGDIVHLYTQWLTSKMAPGGNVFVTDLLKDVETLMKDRKVRPIRIPAGTLMSSSVRLYDEYKQMQSLSQEDCKMYLEEDWLEDIQYLVSVSSTSRRNTVDGEETSSRAVNVGASSDSDSDRDLVIDEDYTSIGGDTSVAEAAPELKMIEKNDKPSRNTSTSLASARRSSNNVKKSLSTPKTPEAFEDHKSDSKDSPYKPDSRILETGKGVQRMESVGKRLRKRESSSIMSDFDYEYEGIVQAESEPKPQKMTPTVSEKVTGKTKTQTTKVTKKIAESPRDVENPASSQQINPSGAKAIGLRRELGTVEEYDVEKIVDYREVHDRNKSKYYKYLVRWVGFGPEDDTWVDEKDLYCAEKVAEYWRILKREKQLRFVRMKSTNTIQYTPGNRVNQGNNTSGAAGENKVGSATPSQKYKALKVMDQSKLDLVIPIHKSKAGKAKDQSKLDLVTPTHKSKAGKAKDQSKLDLVTPTQKSKAGKATDQSQLNLVSPSKKLKAASAVEACKAEPADSIQKHKTSSTKKGGKTQSDNSDPDFTVNIKEESNISVPVRPRRYKSQSIKQEDMSSDTPPEFLDSPDAGDETDEEKVTPSLPPAPRKRGRPRNPLMCAMESPKKPKENGINIIEAMIQHASADRAPSSKPTKDIRQLVTRRELLDLYDNWRLENQNVLLAGGSNTVNVDILVSRAKDLMATKGIKAFNHESLLSACFMMTLMRMRLKNERALNTFMESSCLEVLEASYRLHRSAQQKHHDRDKQEKEVSSDKKANVANLWSDLQKIRHKLSLNLEQRLVSCSALNLFEEEVECLEKVMKNAKVGRSQVTSCLRQELFVVKSDLISLQSKVGAESRMPGAFGQDKTTKKATKKSHIDLTDARSNKLRGEVLNVGQDLIKCGVPSKKIDSLIELVVHNIGDRRIRDWPDRTPSISAELEASHIL